MTSLEISDESIIEVTTEDDVTTIVLGDKQIFGNSVITLLFEPETFELRQWTIKDAQGKETSVMVFNVEDNVELSNRDVPDQQGPVQTQELIVSEPFACRNRLVFICLLKNRYGCRPTPL